MKKKVQILPDSVSSESASKNHLGGGQYADNEKITSIPDLLKKINTIPLATPCRLFFRGQSKASWKPEYLMASGSCLFSDDIVQDMSRLNENGLAVLCIHSDMMRHVKWFLRMCCIVGAVFLLSACGKEKSPKAESDSIMTYLEIIYYVCASFGAIGTAATFILSICDLKKKSNQIESVQKIQSLQLEQLYKPDIRIASWRIPSEFDRGGMSEIVVENHGEDLVVSDIFETKPCLLNRQRISTWFPYHFDSDAQIHIPLSTIRNLQDDGEIVIRVKNKLGHDYDVKLLVSKKGVKVCGMSLLNSDLESSSTFREHTQA